MKPTHNNIEDVIKEYGEDNLRRIYVNSNLYGFMEKYNLRRTDIIKRFGKKYSPENIPFIDGKVTMHKLTVYSSDEYAAKIKTEREEQLAKTGEANRLANKDYKYEPVYTHGPCIKLPLTVYARNNS